MSLLCHSHDAVRRFHNRLRQAFANLVCFLRFLLVPGLQPRCLRPEPDDLSNRDVARRGGRGTDMGTGEWFNTYGWGEARGGGGGVGGKDDWHSGHHSTLADDTRVGHSCPWPSSLIAAERGRARAGAAPEPFHLEHLTKQTLTASGWGRGGGGGWGLDHHSGARTGKACRRLDEIA